MIAPRITRRERLVARVGRFLWHRDEFRVYRYRLAELPPRVDRGAIRRDQVPDLELYEPTAPWWLPKRTFLSMARQRLAAGEHVYTFVTPDRLLHYAWLADRREETLVREVEQTFRYAIPGAVLYDAYTVPEARGRGLHTRSVAARLHDARALAAASWAYVGCLAGNRASRTVIETAGFAHYASLYRLQALGLVSRWQGQGMLERA
jgi:GNAT superfamily N-acetyltransferase